MAFPIESETVEIEERKGRYETHNITLDIHENGDIDGYIEVIEDGERTQCVVTEFRNAGYGWNRQMGNFRKVQPKRTVVYENGKLKELEEPEIYEFDRILGKRDIEVAQGITKHIEV